MEDDDASMDELFLSYAVHATPLCMSCVLASLRPQLTRRASRAGQDSGGTSVWCGPSGASSPPPRC